MTPTPTPEARLLRDARWRLVAWSGGLTLAALLVLGGLIYVSVARSLADAAQAELERQASGVATPEVVRGTLIRGGGVALPADGPSVGVTFLGPASGSLTIVIEPNGTVVGPRIVETLGLPNEAGVMVARAGETDVREAEVADRSVRILTRPLETPAGTFIVQVLQDLGEEQRALAALRSVLLLGGFAVLVAAVGLGWLYAGRALVPIRESMRRQREFAADAGHELRTPLAVVKASVEDLRRSDAVAAEGSLDEIDRQADRLTELVDELLIFARMQSGTLELERQPLRLDEAVATVTQRLDRLARDAGVAIRADLSPTTVTGDRRRLEQLIGVILDNAIRHSPRGATVRVQLARVRHAVELTVDDAGPGIPADELERVFDRYYRARTARPGGVGLGLAIARWIAEGHGGQIQAINRDEGGARFVLRLPE